MVGASASPASAMERATSRFDALAIASQLLTRGFYVCDHFLDSPPSTAAVLAGIQALDSTGKMRVGKIQQGINLKSNTDSRTDRIAFLPSPQATKSRKQADDILRKREALNTDSSATLTVEAEDCNEALLAYTHAADAMRAQLTDVKALVERVGGVLDDCNYMCACYPGEGARYVKHRDALPYKAGRKLTVIYYLNANWEPGHGGELRIWPADDEHTETPVVVEPIADRLVIFISSLEHEVLAAWRPRYALTTWMFNRRDTALESFAEEMRKKKAEGKFNTAALLAAIEADSSDDDDADKPTAAKPAARKPPPPAPPHGEEFLNLAKAGDMAAMVPLLRANPELLMYHGQVRPALHLSSAFALSVGAGAAHGAVATHADAHLECMPTRHPYPCRWDPAPLRRVASLG